MRPCQCDQCDTTPGAPYQRGNCRLCWLFHHDERYRVKWVGGVVKSAKPKLSISELAERRR